jgi:simple sugar transport system permease protein
MQIDFPGTFRCTLESGSGNGSIETTRSIEEFGESGMSSQTVIDRGSGSPGGTSVGGTTQAASRPWVWRMLSRPESGSLAGAIAVFIVFYSLAPAFRLPASWTNMAYEAAILGIPAVAVALLMIGGEFDLSPGVAVFSSALAAAMFSYQFSVNVWVGIGVGLLVSLAIGFFNGWLLITTRIPSFLVTLATFLMLQGINIGLTKVLTGNVATNDVSDMEGFDSAKAVFATEIQIGGVQLHIAVLWWLVFVAIGTWVLLRTRVGNWIYATGCNQDAARAVGVPVQRVKIGLYLTVGVAAWFTGMVELFSFNVVQSGSGVGNELLYIMAAVVGGCLLTGGYGTAIGAAIGAMIYGMTKQGIVYAGWDNNWLLFFVGIMLLLAVLLNAFVRRQASRR